MWRALGKRLLERWGAGVVHLALRYVMTRYRSVFTALPFVCLLAGCGGGGSQANDVISVQISPSSLAGTVVTGGQAQGFPSGEVTATFTNLPNAQVYPAIVDDHGGIYPGSVTFKKNADGSFSGTLPFNPLLAPGDYSGAVQLHLFKDSSATSEYPLSGGKLPYTLTVLPGITFSVTVNGASGTLTAKPVPWNHFVDQEVTPAAGSYQVVTLTASVPVTWIDLDPFGYSSSDNANAINETTSSTQWSATIYKRNPNPYPGYFYVTATPTTQGAVPIQVHFSIPVN